MEEVTKTSSEALSVKKMFVRYVSHEIRTPLTVSSIGMSKVAEQVVQCKDSIDIAVCILNDLLSYEKLESGILQLNRKPHKAQFFILNAIKPFVLQV
jgi:signal transduction histidine kinase